MIYKQLMTVLEIGNTHDAVGKVQPGFHNAVAHGEDENQVRTSLRRSIKRLCTMTW